MTNNLSTKLLDVIARSWTDADFHKRLTVNPGSALAEHGIEAPHGATVKVIHQKANEMYLFIPPRPHAEINIHNVASHAAESAGLTVAAASPQSAFLTVAAGAAPLTEQHSPLTEPHSAPLTEPHSRLTEPHSALLTIRAERPAPLTEPHSAPAPGSRRKPAAGGRRRGK